MSSKPPEPNVIVERLRVAREQAGLSQGQVAKLLEMHRPTITEIEAGRRRVTADDLVRFADLFGVSLDWLTGKLPERISIADGRVAVAARNLHKLLPKDLERVLGFIAAVRGSKK
jgi:transcriptional regulator with XRE-family HTH domain